MESKIPAGSPKLERKGKIPQTSQIQETPTLGKREVETTAPVRRRTDAVIEQEGMLLDERELETAAGMERRTKDVSHKIDELKDNLAEFDAKALSENFAEIKKFFEQYEEFGIKIPQAILWNFELSEGEEPRSPVYLTEEQAEELKQQASEGEKRLQEKQEMLDQQEKLDQQKITYGPFVTKDIIPKVMEQGLAPADIQNLLSISTSFRKLAKPRMILKGTDLLPPSEKLQHARENNLKLNIKLKTTDDIKVMIDFMNNPDNSNLLNHLEAIDLPDIDYSNIEQTNTLLGLLANRCPNLTSFSCGNIEEPLILPQFKNLTSFSCVDIRWPLTLTQLDNLTSFSCKTIAATVTLTQLNNLISFSCKNIHRPLTLTELDNLTSFSCQTISKTLTLTQLKNLTSFSCGYIHRPLTLTELDNLTSFSCKTIGASLTLTELDKLTTFSCENIFAPLTLTELDNLISFSCGSISAVATLTFSEEFPRLQYIHFGWIDNQSAMEILGNLQAQIQARQSQQLPPQ